MMQKEGEQKQIVKVMISNNQYSILASAGSQSGTLFFFLADTDAPAMYMY